MHLRWAKAALLGLISSQTKLRIMPLGDSITESACWRTLLWSSIASPSLQFVGSMTSNPQNCTSDSADSWDRVHEGHSGALAIDIAANQISGWLEAAKPDIVMFMLGTNDVAWGKSTEEIIEAYTDMVHKMREEKKGMKIIVDLVIPLDIGLNDRIISLNDAIPAWVDSLSTEESPIWIADCYNGFPLSGLRDGVHPSPEGDVIIADRIFPVLLEAIHSALKKEQRPGLWQQVPFLRSG